MASEIERAEERVRKAAIALALGREAEDANPCHEHHENVRILRADGADTLHQWGKLLVAAIKAAEEAAKAEKPLVQGWTYPNDAARKRHFFSNHDLPGHRFQEALCGKYAMWAMDPAQVSTRARVEDDCAECTRQVATLVKLGHLPAELVKA